MPGDVNCNGLVKIDDVILLNRVIAEDTTVTVSDQGLANGECSAPAGLTGDDAVAILMLIAGMVDALPVS